MNTTDLPVRIGNAQAFWGDRTDAAAETLMREPNLDYLTLDYLAEVSMSILAARAAATGSTGGFVHDFVDVVKSLVPYWLAGGRCRIITNAGGLNPRACAAACQILLAEANCHSLRIGVVLGDDVLDLVRAAAASASADFQNLDTGESINAIGGRLTTANAYLGAAPIAQALDDGADIVITGRVADPSLTVGPCIHHFGWKEKDLDRLAGATVAGHLIECGTQVTGGISTDWLEVPDAAHIGFPIAEVFDDGSCIITKPFGTGGCVTETTVKEQLLYEIGDPDNYLSPDVSVSFLSMSVKSIGDNRVRVCGAVGKPQPKQLKVSATFGDGFRSAGTLTIVGRRAHEKARRVGELVLQRVRDAGFRLRDSCVETLGSQINARHSGAPGADDYEEVVLRIAVHADTREAVERFRHEFIPFVTAGPQGTTGYAEGRPRVSAVYRYWPCLIGRDAVKPRVEIVSNVEAARPAAAESACRVAACSPAATPLNSVLTSAPHAAPLSKPRHLYDIAVARSGDKGMNANIGVIARRPEWWEFLRSWLTTIQVADCLAPCGVDSIDRFELPNLCALNFVVHGVLRRGLQTDAQGKALGQLLLELELPADVSHGSTMRGLSREK